MHLRRFATGDEAAAAAADAVAAYLDQAVAARDIGTVALSGGATPRRMFEELAKADLPWPAIHVFQVDERLTREGHPDRNVTLLREHLLAHVHLPVGNFHPMPVGTPSLLEAAERYQRVLEAVCGRPATLDVVHLGLGVDGHTASLVPGEEALDVDDADVAPTGEYGGYRRLTLTAPAIRRARHQVWLVAGADKAEAVAGLMAGNRELPASLAAREDAELFVDTAAAG